MMQDIQVLVDRYSAWLRDEIHLRELGDCIEITTPYLDRHNDYLQIYAKRADGGFVLTDDGYVLDDLELSGYKIDSPKRQDIFRMTPPHLPPPCPPHPPKKIHIPGQKKFQEISRTSRIFRTCGNPVESNFNLNFF